MKVIAAAVALAFVGQAWPARAQQAVSVAFTEGRVTVVARNAPVRMILAEWVRQSGVTLVNGDRVAGPPITIELTGVSEREALEVILRGVAGYMLAPRRAGSIGVSAFDRILILPTSVAVNAPGPGAPRVQASPQPVVQPPLARQPPRMPGPRFPSRDAIDADARPDSQDGDMEAAAGRAREVVRPPSPLRPFLPSSEIEDAEDGAEREAGDARKGPATAVPTSPGNPFGLPPGASATPGVVAPAPAQPQARPPQQTR